MSDRLTGFEDQVKAKNEKWHRKELGIEEDGDFDDFATPDQFTDKNDAGEEAMAPPRSPDGAVKAAVKPQKAPVVSYRYGSKAPRKYNILAQAHTGGLGARKQTSAVKTRDTTLSSGAGDTRRPSDIHSTQHPGSTPERAGGVRYSANMGVVETKRGQKNELQELLREREQLVELTAGLTEERDVLERILRQMQQENSNMLDHLPGLESAVAQCEEECETKVDELIQTEDEYNMYKEERIKLQQELAVTRQELNTLQRDAKRTHSARTELEGIRTSQAHKDKGALIERVAKKESQNAKNLKAIIALRGDTANLIKEKEQLEGRIRR